MTDFLTRLTERTLGHAAVVQPLVVPWATPPTADQTGIGPESGPLVDDATGSISSPPRRDTDPAKPPGEARDAPPVVPTTVDSPTHAPNSLVEPRGMIELRQRDEQTSIQEPPAIVDSAWEPEPTSAADPRLAESSEPVVEDSPAGHADRRMAAGLGSGEGFDSAPQPIDRAASGRESGDAGGSTTESDAGEPRPWIVPVLPEKLEYVGRRPTTAADSPAAPFLEAVQREKVPAEEARRSATAVPSASSKQRVNHASAAARPMAESTAPEEPAGEPERAPLEIPPGNRTISTVRHESRSESGREPKPVVDTRREPEPIVAPQHTSPHPSAMPAGEIELLPPAERSAPPPTVRVTIGRIEVRATLPTPPASTREPPRPRRPALSLDDYLKRRNGESR